MGGIIKKETRIVKKLKEKKVLYLIAILIVIWIILNIIAFLVGLVGGILFSWYGLATAVEYSSRGGYSTSIATRVFLALFAISVIIIVKTPSIVRNLKSKINEEKNKLI